MKKLFIYLSFAILIINSHGLYGQSFTVNVESTKNYSHHIEPIKPTGSRQLLIDVKNNSTITYTLSIDKSLMGVVESWVSIEDNSQVILSGQSKTFKLTISVSSGACECLYYLPLNFDAEDDNHNIYTFYHNDQIIIVDNSLPSSPTFNVSQTSESIYLTGIYSFDERSNIYTSTNNNDLGFWGIKEFKIEIKEPDGTIAKTKIFKHDEGYNHNFTELVPNTDYKAVVTAVDFVDFTKSTEKSAPTAPAKPTNLNFSNITYIDAILNWSPSAGATGYDVYKSNNLKLNSSPITVNSFLVEDMDPETGYEYYVRALNSGGQSDKSDNALVNTLALPSIVGKPYFCSGTHTYTVQNLVSGYTVSWTYDSSRLYLVSASGSSASFSKILDGGTSINASITAPNDRVLELEEIDVWGGKPAMPTTLPSGYPTVQLNLDQLFTVRIDSMPGCFNVDSVYWWSTGSIVEVSSTTGSQCTFEAISLGTGNFYIKTENGCGFSPTGGGTVNVSGGGGGPLGPMLLVYPNPATESFEIQLDESVTTSDEKEIESEIRIYDQYNSLKEIRKFRGKKYKIYTNRLTKGLYLIEVVNKNGKFTTKVIVNKK